MCGAPCSLHEAGLVVFESDKCALSHVHLLVRREEMTPTEVPCIECLFTLPFLPPVARLGEAECAVRALRSWTWTQASPCPLHGSGEDMESPLQMDSYYSIC